MNSFTMMFPKFRLVTFIGCLALSVLMESVITMRGLSSMTLMPSNFSFSLSPWQRQHADDSYRSPLEEFQLLVGRQQQQAVSKNATAALSLPGPLGVIEQYKAWHSQEALLRDPHNRKFIVAYYQCPISAGNWLHYFTSHFYWAILTNRTILWKYVDNDTCLRIRDDYDYPFDIRRCNVTASTTETTQQADCHNILTRAPWIAGYDEWKERLQLPEQIHHIEREHSQWFSKILRPPFQKKLESSKFIDIIYNDKLVVDVHPWAFLRMDYFYWMPELREMQLGTRYARETVEKLGEWGSQFLFGLLWRYSFDYTERIRESVLANSAVQQSEHDNKLTVAMHSRHTYPKDDGCNVTQEQAGMQSILQQYRQTNSLQMGDRIPCQVTLLSDRTCTIDSMKEWLDQELGCKSVMAQHDTVDAVFSEHGPFSGAGFFQDMLMAGLTARDGMIGSLEPFDGHRWRSSSELIEESVAYYRTMHHFSSGRDPKELAPMYWSTVIRDVPTYGGKPLPPQKRKSLPRKSKRTTILKVSQVRAKQMREFKQMLDTYKSPDDLDDATKFDERGDDDDRGDDDNADDDDDGSESDAGDILTDGTTHIGTNEQSLRGRQFVNHDE